MVKYRADELTLDLHCPEIDSINCIPDIYTLYVIYIFSYKSTPSPLKSLTAAWKM